MNFEDSARDLIKIESDEKNNEDDGHEAIDKLYYGKYSCLLCQIKFRVSILSIITFLITLCCDVFFGFIFALYTIIKSWVLNIY